MGIWYCGVICVGYEWDELESLYDCSVDQNGEYEHEDYYGFCEDNDLESFSPYFDASKEDCIFGRVIAQSNDYHYSEVSHLDSKIEKVVKELMTQFGVKPRAYIMAYGC